MELETRVSAAGHCWLVSSQLCAYRREPGGETEVCAPRYQAGRRMGWTPGITRLYPAATATEVAATHAAICAALRAGTLRELPELVRVAEHVSLLARLRALWRTRHH